METTVSHYYRDYRDYVRVIMGFYRGHGKEHGNYRNYIGVL